MPSPRPEVLVVTSTYPRWRNDTEPGFVHHLNKELQQEFNLTVLTPHFRGAKCEETLDGIRVRRFRYMFPAWEVLINNGGILSNLKANPLKLLLVPFLLFFETVSIVRSVRKYRPDLIHAHWIIPQGLCLWLAGCLCRLPPVVITSHGADLFSLKGRILEGIKIKALQKAACITVVSSVMKEHLISLGVSETKVVVASMGVDFSGVFNAFEKLSPGQKQIIFAGRLVEKKGLQHLISAMPVILGKHPDARLVIAGYGPLKDSLHRKCLESGILPRVVFTGAVSQESLATQLANSSLFVAPFIRTKSGDQEGLGLVTLEAMGMGLPVIVGNVPAVRDVAGLLDDEIVDPQDTAELARRVISVLDEPEKYASRAMARREKVVSSHSWPVAATAYKLVFRRCLLQQVIS